MSRGGKPAADADAAKEVATPLVALLRGINVGRAKRVAMSDLRDLLADLGYADVKTHLQSGNAVFGCPPGSVATAAADIERALSGRLGVDCRVIVRTAADLDEAMAADPLLDVATDPSRHLVGFLEDDPAPDGVRLVESIDVPPDRIALVGRHAYLWCPAGVLASPLNKIGWERSLGCAVTMRNWNTVRKLATLARG